MKIVVDVGNTTTVLALVEGKQIKKTWRVETDVELSAPRLWETWVGQVGLSVEHIDIFLVASVVPKIDAKLVKIFKEKDDKILWFLKYPWPSVLKIALEKPETVGADRIACASALYFEYGSGIVVDFGTATTVEAVEAGGRYCGGVIMPGVRATLAGLAEVTARLPRLSPEKPEEFSTRNTAAAMQSGIFYGLAGAVERAIEELRRKYELPADCMVVATGGRGGDFLELCPSLRKEDEHLVLKGIMLSYEEKLG
ncbi:MAG: type III pantothenate kinase [bacterium]